MRVSLFLLSSLASALCSWIPASAAPSATTGTTSATPPPLDGLWAVHYDLKIASKLPLFGSIHSNTRQWALLNMQTTAEGVQVVQRTCSVQIKNPIMRTIVPDRWAQTIPMRAWTATLTAQPSGWTFRADMGEAATGYDPALGPLPTKASDASTVDQDLDGKPGVTLLVKPPLGGQGEIYLVSRTEWQLIGSVQRDAIDGELIIIDASQNILGASSRWLNSSLKSGPVPGQSSFGMRRLPDNTTCSTMDQPERQARGR